ncbi:hypothetical protein V2J09_018412 [Rumex salicifolius]
MHAPTDVHFSAIKRILRYVQGTSHIGLHLNRSSINQLNAYFDADWAGCPDTHRSTSGNNLISWSSKRQNQVSRSSADAENRAVANTVAEATWLRQLLTEMGIVSTQTYSQKGYPKLCSINSKPACTFRYLQFKLRGC